MWLSRPSKFIDNLDDREKYGLTKNNQGDNFFFSIEIDNILYQLWLIF